MAVTLSGLTATSVHLSGNDIWVKATTSGIPAGAEDYMILLKIEASTLIGSPFVDAIVPDSNGEAWFNFSGYVNQGVPRMMQWPIGNDAIVFGWQDHNYTVRLYAGERYINSEGNLVENFNGTALQPIFILPGRLPDREVALLNDANITWWDKYCSNGQFFSYMPATQNVTPYQPVKLYWVPPVTNLSVVVKYKYYMENGTTGIKNIYIGGMWYDMLWEIECCPLLMDLPTGSRLKKYEVWIEDSSGSIVCAKRTFNVVHNPPVNKYWYLFADNGMGGIECIGLTGRCILEPQGERTVVTVPFERGSGVMTGTSLTKTANRKRKWKIDSGWKSKEELEAMEFFLDSQHAWLAIPPADGNPDLAHYRLAPITIDNARLVLGNDMEETESIELELTEAL